jgi:cysteine synthase A
MIQNGDYLRAFETPRFARLAPNLNAACFSLMKLMPARFMVDRAEATGRLAPGGHIVETTSGTFGLAIAMLAAARGYDLTLVTASSLIDVKLTRRLQQLGAEVWQSPIPRETAISLAALNTFTRCSCNSPTSIGHDSTTVPRTGLPMRALRT